MTAAKTKEKHMIQPIVHDQLFLSQKSQPATTADLGIAADLLETLRSHASECVGMAANMIGASKRIIAFDNEGEYLVMFNPEIVKGEDPYEAEEGCLSLSGRRPVTRYRCIKVRYQNAALKTRLRTFEGSAAQIIQHEIDHCDGILI